MAPPHKRVKGVSVSRPILYGNTAVPMKESDRTPEMPAEHTHKWTIFVRDANFPPGVSGKAKNQAGDLSYYIKKVVFKLHDTYPNPLRTVEQPPFELTETGWGEFEIGIRIYFYPETGEKNLSFYHHLKLHPYPKDSTKPLADDEKPPPQPVESYMYDEIVFNEPTEAMFEMLIARPGAGIPPKTTQAIKFSTQAENKELERISTALDKVYQQVQKTKDRILRLEDEKKKLS